MHNPCNLRDCSEYFRDMPSADFWEAVASMIRSVEYCHSIGLVHGDIALDNFVAARIFVLFYFIF